MEGCHVDKLGVRVCVQEREGRGALRLAGKPGAVRDWREEQGAELLLYGEKLRSSDMAGWDVRGVGRRW